MIGVMLCYWRSCGRGAQCRRRVPAAGLLLSCGCMDLIGLDCEPARLDDACTMIAFSRPGCRGARDCGLNLGEATPAGGAGSGYAGSPQNFGLIIADTIRFFHRDRVGYILVAVVMRHGHDEHMRELPRGRH
jgi:hypothetical protein